ncbi:hypothetical protein BDY24DRAFT_220147 [Mrakia frigida]|uniref:cytochrome c oxidase subunit 7 n=1 Tax=Mrakia frigida TaxID=29902 RepID=UPI003FCC0F5E
MVLLCFLEDITLRRGRKMHLENVPKQDPIRSSLSLSPSTHHSPSSFIMLRATLPRRSAMIPANGGPSLRTPVDPATMGWYSRMTLGRNNILEQQRAYQAESHVPSYLRGNGKYYYRIWLASFGVSTVFTGQALYQLMQVSFRFLLLPPSLPFLHLSPRLLSERAHPFLFVGSCGYLVSLEISLGRFRVESGAWDAAEYSSSKEGIWVWEWDDEVSPLFCLLRCKAGLAGTTWWRCGADLSSSLWVGAGLVVWRKVGREDGKGGVGRRCGLKESDGRSVGSAARRMDGMDWVMVGRGDIGKRWTLGWLSRF